MQKKVGFVKELPLTKTEGTHKIYKRLEIIMNCNKYADYVMAVRKLEADHTFKKYKYGLEYPPNEWRLRFFMWQVRELHKEYVGERFDFAVNCVADFL